MSTRLRSSTCLFALLALVLPVGCDVSETSPIDDAELRDIDLGSQNPVVPIVKRPPLYPVDKVEKGDEVPWSAEWIHQGYDPSSGATRDDSGHTMYGFDSNSLLPYGRSDVWDSVPACDAFLDTYDAVPISPQGTLGFCAEAEQGCCDFVCKEWGGHPDPQNRVAFVDQSVMDVKDVKQTYVPAFLAWDDTDPAKKGGHGRAKACACNCQ